MTHDLRATIRLLGETREYSDGAEDKVLSILENVIDRSEGSDELWHHATDWPTTYHFSPRRANLLRPFDIPSNARVLEIGAGTGAVTRYLGELGVSVVALEGDQKRARALALRCAGLDNVNVVCGVLSKLEDSEPFDLVVVVGVLEYAGGETAGHGLQLDFLRHTAGFVGDSGSLVLGIENQLGLKYLLGYSEDHLAEPWSGVAGYPGNPPIRTFPRRTLASLLERAGLPAQRWFYPYPDYKLPHAILTEAAYGHPQGTEIVDQLVGKPVEDLANPPTLFCDDRAAHRVFLAAGLGPEIANSFLVLAGHDQSSLDLYSDRRSVAWHFSSERRKHLRRHQVIRETDDGLVVESRATFAVEPTAQPGWLDHDPVKNEPFVLGRTIEQQALEACRRRDREALETVLERWRSELETRVTTTSNADDPESPFSSRDRQRVLPPEFLDIGLSNFIDDGNRLEFIDREWRVGVGVDPDLVQFRALWYFATELVISGSEHPFSSRITIDQLTARLGELAGAGFNDELTDRFYSSEARLQEIVIPSDATTIERELRDIGRTSRDDQKVARLLPVHQIRRDLVSLNASVETLGAQAEEAQHHHRRLEIELSRAVLRIAELESTLMVRDRLHDAISEELDKASEWAGSLEEELGHAQKWAEDLTDRLNQKTDVEIELRAELDRQRKDQQEDRSRLEAEIENLKAIIGDLEASCARHEENANRKLVRAALAAHRLLDRSGPPADE